VRTKNKDHPPYIDMIIEAIIALGNRKGSSKSAIVKFIRANHNVGDRIKNIDQIIKMTISHNVGSKLKRMSGVGANGSFKVYPKITAKPVPKKAVKKSTTKKPAAKKPAAKKPAAKKPAAKKTSAKKTPAKKVTKTKISLKKKPTAKKK